MESAPGNNHGRDHPSGAASTIPPSEGTQDVREVSAISLEPPDSFVSAQSAAGWTGGTAEGTGAAVEWTGQAASAPEQTGWTQSQTMPASGGSAITSPDRGSYQSASPGYWAQQGNAWSRSSWVDYSTPHRQDQGWAPGSWRAGQKSSYSHASAPASQKSSPHRDARHAHTPQASCKAASGGVFTRQQAAAKAPTQGAYPSQSPTQSSSGQGAGQEIPPGDNFNRQPYFAPVPQGSRIHRLITKFVDFGLPRDPATYAKWQSTLFSEFPPVPDGWIRIWDEIGNGPACFRIEDGATLLGSNPGYLPSVQSWRDRPRKRQVQDKPSGKKKTQPNSRAWMLENLRAARNDAIYISPEADEDTPVEDEEPTPPPTRLASPSSAPLGWGAQQQARAHWQPPTGNLDATTSLLSGGGVAPVSGPASAHPLSPQHGQQVAGVGAAPVWGHTSHPPHAASGSPGFPPPPAPEVWTNKQFHYPLHSVSSPLVPLTADLMLNPGNRLLLDWTVPFWPNDTGPPLRDLVGTLKAELYPFFHTMAAKTAEAVLPPGAVVPRSPASWEQADGAVAQVTLNQLPWDAMLQAIILCAASERGMTPSRGVHFGLACLKELLHSYGVLTREGFAAHMEGFAGRPPIRNLLAMSGGYTVGSLRKTCVPGAWLLDTVHTLVNAMHGRVQSYCQYMPVSNAALGELFNCCFPSQARDGTGASQNNRGNQIEALAWLVMEMNRMDLLLAMAFHLDIWTTGGGAACDPGTTGTPGVGTAMSSDTMISRDLEAYLSRAATAAATHPSGSAPQANAAPQQHQSEHRHYPQATWCDSQGPHPAPHQGQATVPASQDPSWGNQRRSGGYGNDWGTPAANRVPFKAAPPFRQESATATHPSWSAPQASTAPQPHHSEQRHCPPAAWGGSQGPHPALHQGQATVPASQDSSWDSQLRSGSYWNDWGTPATSSVPFKAAPPPRQEFCRPQPSPPYIFSHLGKAPMGPPPYPADTLPRQCFPS